MLLQAGKVDDSDSFRGVVRLSREAMEKLELRPGDAVYIKGRRLTAVRVWRGKVERILMDEITARNAGISFGEHVEVGRAKVKTARKVVLVGEVKVWLPSTFGGFEGYVKNAFLNMVFVRGNILASSPEEVLKVVETEPDGVVRMGKDAEVALNPNNSE